MGSKPSSLNQMFSCGSKKKKTPVEETYFHHELDSVLAHKEGMWIQIALGLANS